MDRPNVTLLGPAALGPAHLGQTIDRHGALEVAGAISAPASLRTASRTAAWFPDKPKATTTFLSGQHFLGRLDAECARGELVPEDVLLNFAGGRDGHGLDEAPVRGRLVRRHLGPAEGPQLAGGRSFGGRVEADDRSQLLAPHLVRYTDHGSFGHRRMRL